MHCTKKVTEDVIWLGGNDRRLALFEGVYPIERGVAYNSYLLLDEKTALMDTADKAVAGLFLENLEYADIIRGSNEDFRILYGLSDSEAVYRQQTYGTIIHKRHIL